MRRREVFELLRRVEINAHKLTNKLEDKLADRQKEKEEELVRQQEELARSQDPLVQIGKALTSIDSLIEDDNFYTDPGIQRGKGYAISYQDRIDLIENTRKKLEEYSEHPALDKNTVLACGDALEGVTDLAKRYYEDELKNEPNRRGNNE